MDGPTLEQIAQFVARRCGVPLADVRPASRLEEDFGLTGDDAAEFMGAYARAFGVDLEAMEFARHFGPEGCLPGLGVCWLLRHGYRIGGEPVTPRLLLDAARAGRWPDFRHRNATT